MKLQHYIEKNEEVTTHVLVVDMDGASAMLPISAEQLDQMRAIWRERWMQKPGSALMRLMEDRRAAGQDKRWRGHAPSQHPRAIATREWRERVKAKKEVSQ